MVHRTVTSLDECVNRRSDVRLRVIRIILLIRSSGSSISNRTAVPSLVLELILALDEAQSRSEPDARHGERVAATDVQLLQHQSR